MKRFFFTSFLFHGVALLLLFSWESPRADRLFPRNILEVSLVEIAEEKPEVMKSPGTPPEPVAEPVKKKIDQKKKVEAAPRVAPVKKELKKEEPKKVQPAKVQPEKVQPKKEQPKPEQPKKEEPQQEVAPVRAATDEEKPKTEEEVPPPRPILEEKPEEPSVMPANAAAPTPGGGNAGQLALPGGGPRVTEGKADSGIAFLASGGAEKESGAIPVGKGGQGSTSGPGDGGTARMASIQPSSPDGDPLIAEIMRRIEGAKRYPRVARRMGIEGMATVRFKLKPNGKVDSAQVVESSGSDLLDNASLETIQRAAPLPFKEGWLKVVIVFKIL